MPFEVVFSQVFSEEDIPKAVEEASKFLAEYPSLASKRLSDYSVYLIKDAKSPKEENRYTEVIYGKGKITEEELTAIKTLLRLNVIEIKDNLLKAIALKEKEKLVPLDFVRALIKHGYLQDLDSDFLSSNLPYIKLSKLYNVVVKVLKEVRACGIKMDLSQKRVKDSLRDALFLDGSIDSHFSETLLASRFKSFLAKRLTQEELNLILTEEDVENCFNVLWERFSKEKYWCIDLTNLDATGRAFAEMVSSTLGVWEENEDILEYAEGNFINICRMTLVFQKFVDRLLSEYSIDFDKSIMMQTGLGEFLFTNSEVIQLLPYSDLPYSDSEVFNEYFKASCFLKYDKHKAALALAASGKTYQLVYLPPGLFFALLSAIKSIDHGYFYFRIHHRDLYISRKLYDNADEETKKRKDLYLLIAESVAEGKEKFEKTLSPFETYDTLLEKIVPIFKEKLEKKKSQDTFLEKFKAKFRRQQP